MNPEHRPGPACPQRPELPQGLPREPGKAAESERLPQVGSTWAGGGGQGESSVTPQSSWPRRAPPAPSYPSSTSPCSRPSLSQECWPMSLLSGALLSHPPSSQLLPLPWHLFPKSNHPPSKMPPQIFLESPFGQLHPRLTQTMIQNPQQASSCILSPQTHHHTDPESLTLNFLFLHP